ncbi:MAG: FAD-dependent oxidoreductase [Archangium sp.]
MLPPHLAERLEPGAPPPRDGDAVVYWMRVAARAWENPALDVALVAAKALGKPLCVYQCVSTGGLATDRQQAFVWEGVREVEAVLTARGVACVVEQRLDAFDATRFSRAALVVSDFSPVPSLRAEDDRAKGCAPLWRVDASCLIPVWKFTRPASGLEAFLSWRALEHFTVYPEEAFTPFPSRASFTISDAVDHSVAPVHHTRGGSTCAVARWRSFTGNELSPLSAYLHYGHLSPFTVARETPRLGVLLEHRELAWNFCLHHEKPASFEALPGWARETLQLHDRDPRGAMMSWEQLARAQTGDLVWDAIARQLLVHGEVSAPLRDVWLKALLPWSRTASEAMHVASELLGRYALDGNAPTTHAGIALAFGAFENPYPLETPFFGVVRSASTKELEKHLDVGEFERRAHRPSRGSPLTVAIIGAGVAGAAAARTLVDAGHVVTLFDRGRAPGGRLMTRSEGPLRFDLGAPYFTVRDERFARWARGWWQERVLAQWKGVIEGEVREEASDLVKLVGVPSMDLVVKRLLLGLDVRSGVDVNSLTRDGSRWRLMDSEGASLGEYEVAVVATQPSRASQLVDPSSYELASRIREVTMEPRWAVMAHFNEGLGLPWDGLKSTVGPLAWLAKNSSKPERPLLSGESWVLHASAEWSRAHVDDDEAEVAAMLMDALWATTGARPQTPLFVDAHRWKSALVEKPLGVSCLWDETLQLAVCGDWCLGARVEDAFLSGTAAAGRINELPGGELPSQEAPRRPEFQLQFPLHAERGEG